jgi:hypothetical protein
VPEPEPRPGDVAVLPLPDGWSGACQVTGADTQIVAAYAYRWRSQQPPSLTDLADAPPLLVDHHAYSGEIEQLCISRSDPMPAGSRWLGRLPVPGGIPARSETYASWGGLALQIMYQLHWEERIPDTAKLAYARAATRGPVQVDFGGGPVSLAGGIGRLDLTPSGALVPADVAVRWDALDHLGRCTNIRWTGPDRGLSAALAGHPLISTIVWDDAPAEVDLSGTGVQNLTISGPSLRRLTLPSTLIYVNLSQYDPQLVVQTNDYVRLGITLTGDAAIPDGLRGVSHLVVEGGGEITADRFSGLPNLLDLTITFRTGPGELRNLSAMSTLDKLVNLTLTDAYAVDASLLPDLPALAYLGLNGVRRSTVAAVKARYRTTPVRLSLSGAKNDTWLAANLDNPFRDWADDDERGGAAACKAYAAAVRAIDKGEDASSALQRLVKELNRIDSKYAFIDTLRREEAGDAFHILAARAGVDEDEADRWFDSWRDF